MIEILEGFPDTVVAFAGRGRLTKKDYDEILIPKVKQALVRGGKVRLYYDLGQQFAGIDSAAAWEDFRLGIEHFSRWERVAVVTDVNWIRLAMNVFRFLMPGQMRVFETRQADEAKAWIGSA